MTESMNISLQTDNICVEPSPAPATWLNNEEYLTVLRATHTVAFEYDPAAKKQLVTSNISELVSGNYDGRMLSNVMLEDGIIHPEDLEISLRFREQARSGTAVEIVLRLKDPHGTYRWFRMGLYPHKRGNHPVYVGVLTDVDNEVRQKEILRYRAEYDPVSDIYNKATFFAYTRELLKAEPHIPHYLLRFDIDRFKLVNELYSSKEGDRLLRFIGSILRDFSLPGETFSRLGNDVYCVCLTRSEEAVLHYIDELTQRMNTYPLNFTFVFSVGIVRISEYAGESIDILCDRAAMAQRSVKGSYIRHYAFYEEWMSRELNREHFIIGNMHRALNEREFKLYLQPKYDVTSNLIVGAESLVRWVRPTGEIIPPSEFVPMFERNGFIIPLDEYIWEETCKYLEKWRGLGLTSFPVSVNVSRLHLHDKNLCDKLLKLIRKYHLTPRMLELEITESAYLESPQMLYEIMDRLQSMGFMFLMDDFGSGYSSLNSLKDIPVDIIKLDLNFLKDSRRGESIGKNILHDTVRLIQNIGLPVIVEGVENQKQADFLITMGCYIAQGYYYSKPMPAPEFEQLILTQQGLNATLQ